MKKSQNKGSAPICLAPDQPTEAMDAGPGTCPHCYQPLPDPKPIVAHHGLEVRGLLRAIELTEDDFIIATIGALRVVYRADEEVQLRPFLGQRIGTIMIDQTLRVRGLARDGGMQA